MTCNSYFIGNLLCAFIMSLLSSSALAAEPRGLNRRSFLLGTGASIVSVSFASKTLILPKSTTAVSATYEIVVPTPFYRSSFHPELLREAFLAHTLIPAVESPRNSIEEILEYNNRVKLSADKMFDRMVKKAPVETRNSELTNTLKTAESSLPGTPIEFLSSEQIDNLVKLPRGGISGDHGHWHSAAYTRADGQIESGTVRVLTSTQYDTFLERFQRGLITTTRQLVSFVNSFANAETQMCSQMLVNEAAPPNVLLIEDSNEPDPTR